MHVQQLGHKPSLFQHVQRFLFARSHQTKNARRFFVA
jgi:hypothetical protein